MILLYSSVWDCRNLPIVDFFLCFWPRALNICMGNLRKKLSIDDPDRARNVFWFFGTGRVRWLVLISWSRRRQPCWATPSMVWYVSARKSPAMRKGVDCISMIRSWCLSIVLGSCLWPTLLWVDNGHMVLAHDKFCPPKVIFIERSIHLLRDQMRRANTERARSDRHERRKFFCTEKAVPWAIRM